MSSTPDESENQDMAEQKELPVVELFVKASPVEPETFGSCPMSQKWFMAFYMLVRQRYVVLRLTPIDLKNKRQEYVDLNVGNKLPVLLVVSGSDPITGDDVSGKVFETDDLIEQFMSRFNYVQLSLAASAFEPTQNLYRNFNLFIIGGNSNAMLNDLRKLDEYLGNRGVKFLQGDEISYVDCVVAPKLHHLRISLRHFKDFTIPEDLRNVWSYLANLYEDEIFQNTVPSDRDILIHYADKIASSPAPPGSSNAAPVVNHSKMMQSFRRMNDSKSFDLDGNPLASAVDKNGDDAAVTEMTTAAGDD